MSPSRREAIGKEFKEVKLADARLNTRLQKIVSAVAKAPKRSFPRQMKGSAELEGAYRFFANDAVEAQSVLAPHVRQTHERMKQFGVCLAVHDTTALHYRGDRDGIGPLTGGKGSGFLAHICLAVSPTELREPLGVLGFSAYIHKHTASNKRRSRNEVKEILKTTPRAEKESSRWEKLAIEVSTALPEAVEVIHVMDQEADDYALLGELQKAGLRFVTRTHLSRETIRGSESIGDVLDKEAFQVFRAVNLSQRPVKKAKGRHPPRQQREAALSIRWSTLTIQKARWSQSDVSELEVRVVHVLEENPPEGEQATEWLLLTNEPVETLEQATVIVDAYRARWLIEEFNKALKTGCDIEHRQLTTFDALVRALAMFLPMAWHLLALRHLGRAAAPLPATHLFRVQQLRLLALLLKQEGCDYRLPPNPSIQDAMLGVAALGGHIPNNGPPGWLVLGRGFETFLQASDVMDIVLAAM